MHVPTSFALNKGFLPILDKVKCAIIFEKYHVLSKVNENTMFQDFTDFSIALLTPSLSLSHTHVATQPMKVYQLPFAFVIQILKTWASLSGQLGISVKKECSVTDQV